jgi:hypothetical protein
VASSSIEQADIEFERVVQELPEDLVGLARSFKAFTYARKIRNVQQLLRMVLLYSGLDKSLREVAGNMALLRIRLSDTAVHNRLEACEAWVKALLKQMLEVGEVKVPEGGRIVAVDASTLKVKGSKGTDYRIHLCIDLRSLEFVSIRITDHKTGESLKNYEFHSADVVLADAAHNSISELAELSAEGVQVAVRWNHALPLYHRDGRELDLVTELKDQSPETIRSFPVLLKYTGKKTKKKNKGKEVQGHIHVYRMSEEKAREEKRKKERQCNKNQKQVTIRTLLLCQFVIIFTTLDPDLISGDTVLELYRIRWQIELAFKRLKSLIKINNIRTRMGSKLGELYLSGKLLYALLIERRLSKATQQRKTLCLGPKRKITPWRIIKTIQEQLRPCISASAHWDPGQWSVCLQVMTERPRRKRALQTLPARIDELRAALSANIDERSQRPQRKKIA